MFKQHPIVSYLKFSFIAAFLYAVTVFIFIKDASFRDTWVLYIGNALFAVGITIFVFNRFSQPEKTSTWFVIGAAHITTIMGVIISCLLVALMVLILIPSVLAHHPSSSAMLANSPAQLTGKSNGFLTICFMDAILGNVFAGFFVSILFPFSLSKNYK